MGTVYVAMSEAVLDVQRAIVACRSDNSGAELLFLGAVRNTNEGRTVKAVNYDGHRVLGCKILQDICEEAQSAFGHDLNLWLEHRLGLLAIGEVSLIVHVTSPHRDPAFKASRYAIEQIKLRLPVWKEEIYVEGDQEWLQGKSLVQA